MAKGGRLRRREKRMEKEITRRWTTRFAWKLVSVLAKSYYALSFFPSAPPLSLSLLRLSPLFRSRSLSLSFVSPRSLCSLFLSLSLTYRDESMRAYEHKREKFYSHQHRCRSNVAYPTSSLSSSRTLAFALLSLFLFSLASLLLSNLTPRKRAHNRVSALFNVGGLLLTNTRLKSSSGSFHQPLFLLPPPPSPLPLPPLSSS